MAGTLGTPADVLGDAKLFAQEMQTRWAAAGKATGLFDVTKVDISISDPNAKPPLPDGEQSVLLSRLDLAGRQVSADPAKWLDGPEAGQLCQQGKLVDPPTSCDQIVGYWIDNPVAEQIRMSLPSNVQVRLVLGSGVQPCQAYGGCPAQLSDLKRDPAGPLPQGSDRRGQHQGVRDGPAGRHHDDLQPYTP